jgi:hypothetical protein
VCPRCKEFHNVYWCQNAGSHSADVGSPVSVSSLYLMTVLLTRVFLHLWSVLPCITEEFFLMHCFYFCLFSFQMLSVSLGYYWISRFPSQFQKLLPVYSYLQNLSVC